MRDGMVGESVQACGNVPIVDVRRYAGRGRRLQRFSPGVIDKCREWKNVGAGGWG